MICLSMRACERVCVLNKHNNANFAPISMQMFPGVIQIYAPNRIHAARKTRVDSLRNKI